MDQEFKNGLKIGLVTYGIGLFYASLLFVGVTSVFASFEFFKAISMFLFLLAVAWSVINIGVILGKRFRNGSLGILSVNITFISCYVLIFLIMKLYS